MRFKARLYCVDGFIDVDLQVKEIKSIIVHSNSYDNAYEIAKREWHTYLENYENYFIDVTYYGEIARTKDNIAKYQEKVKEKEEQIEALNDEIYELKIAISELKGYLNEID